MSHREKLEGLTPHTDIFGNKLEVGCRVRSHDFPIYLSKADGFTGIETEGERVAYAVGTLLGIGENYREGCDRYRICVEAWYQSDEQGRVTKNVQRAGEIIYPPVNGTRATLSLRCFGVIRCDPE